MGKNFVVLYPECTNVQLIKDIGMIAYYFHKKYAYHAYVVCTKNGDYPYLTSCVPGLELEFLQHYPEILNETQIMDGEIYLTRNAASIDVLQLLGLGYRTFKWIALYKYLNPAGKVYLKLDASVTNTPLSLPEPLFEVLKLCDVISVESKIIWRKLKEVWPVKVEYIPNGYFRLLHDDIFVNYECKKNIIFTAGRIGIPEKASDVLLAAFANIHTAIPDWKLVLAGPIEESFKPFLEKYFEAYPSLIDRVYFLGNITDRSKLEKVYREAKIFCLPSRKEGFPLAAVEALREGCALMLTNFQSSFDLTNDGKFGKIAPINDTAALQAGLLSLCSNQTILKLICYTGQVYAKDNFNWDILVDAIYKKLQ